MVLLKIGFIFFCVLEVLLCQDPIIKCHDVPHESQNWRNDRVLPVLDQGPVNTCYALMASDILAFSAFHDYGLENYNLSKQQILDCSQVPPYNNDGIHGGLLSFTLLYVHNNPLDFEAAYPYDMIDTANCGRGGPIVGRFTVKSRFHIPPGNKAKFLQCLSAAPLIVSIYVDKDVGIFQNYHSGVLSYECVPGAVLEHYLIVVGYGEIDGEKVMIVKNSWGKSWGYAGYGYVSLAAANPLCIYNDAQRILGKVIPPP